MVDVRTSPRVEAHNVDEILSFRDKIFYPASEWNYFMRRNMQEVIPGVFLGPYTSALEQCQENLLQLGITHIVCIRDVSEAYFIYPRLGENFTYLTLEIADSDTQNIIKFFPIVNNFINNALRSKKKVLVHGNAGISRSASLVLAYVMETYNFTNVQALKLVKEKRGCIKPNEGFAAQLYEYEVIYKTQKFFALAGQSSKMNYTTSKRKYEQIEKSSTVDLNKSKCESVEKLPNSVSKDPSKGRS